MTPVEIKEYYLKKKLLITGGAGYIATNLVRMLKDIECAIIRFDQKDAVFEPIKGKARISDMRGDIREATIWDELLEKCDMIFHFAAQTSVYCANENPIADLAINVAPMLRMLETCRKNDLHIDIVMAGTVTEAGIPNYLPVDEDHPDIPITIYDFHKLTAENYLKYYIRNHFVNGVILRLANVYGPGPKSSSADRGILNFMIKKSLKGENLTVYGKGNFLRDYIFIHDVVKAFLMAGMHIEKLNGNHFVIGSGQGHAIAEAVNMVAERSLAKIGKKVAVEHIEPPSPQSPIESRNFIANTERFNKATHWQAATTLQEGIDRTIDAYLSESKGVTL